MNICIYLFVDIFRGEKYEFVRRWNFYCVCIQWFYDLIQFGFCFEELNYYILCDDENNSFQVGVRLLRSLIKCYNVGMVFFKSSVEKKVLKKVV